MINNLFEAGKLFNLQEGYIKVYMFKFKTRSEIDWEAVKADLESKNHLDNVEINSRNNVIKLPEYLLDL